jgi:hypothetical protein
MMTILSLLSYTGFWMVFELFKRFKDGREDLQDDPRSRRPSASRNADAMANIREMAVRDHRWALRMMAAELNISKEPIRQFSMNIFGRGDPSHTDTRTSRSYGD